MRKLFTILIVVLSTQFSFNLSAECIEGNCIDGQGTYNYPNGDQYSGEHKDNKMHGQGTYYFGKSRGKYSGDRYVGGWKDDKRDRQGTYTFANGEIVHGIWENGKLIKEIEKKQDTNKIPPEIIIGAGS